MLAGDAQGRRRGEGPDATKVLAKRSFIRAATQALEIRFPTTAVTGGALSVADPTTVGWAILAEVPAVDAGTRSYCSIR